MSIRLIEMEMPNSGQYDSLSSGPGPHKRKRLAECMNPLVSASWLWVCPTSKFKLLLS